MTPAAFLDLLHARYSPYAFDPERPVEPASLARVLEAARLAPSSFNEQPWRYLVGAKGDGTAWRRIADALAEKNRAWAEHAPVLMVVCARTTFARNERPNRHARYDAGAATMALALMAAAEGLALHQMAGFDAAAVAEAFGVPEPFEPVAAMALGHPADPDAAPLPDEVAGRDRQRRPRRPLGETAFGEAWGESLELPSVRGPS